MIQMPPVKMQFFPLDGGIDEHTAPFSLKPGVMRSGKNVEIGINGGITTLTGYDRYSGKARPSDAVYATLSCDISGVVVGDTLQNLAGTASGKVIALADKAVLTQLVGTFAVEDLYVGAALVGTSNGPQSVSGAPTPALHATYKNLAADVYRVLIAAVPGYGSVLGVWQYNDKVYAFRNYDTPGTVAKMYVSSTSGWTEVVMPSTISFGTGLLAPAEGASIKGATSGATAVVRRVVRRTGFWGTTATGILVVDTVTGTWQSGELIKDPTLATTYASAASVCAQIVLDAGGRYEFANWNFGVAERMYGCSGVNKAFEFDGTYYVPIATGMTTDTPLHICTHKNHLFLTFGSSMQHSSIADPYGWSPVTGNAEFNCGDTASGFVGLPGTAAGSALGVRTRNRTLILYGDDATNWNFVPVSEEVGALPYTLQYITQAFCLDTQGIQTFATTQEYGNFNSAIVSRNVSKSLSPLINTVTASCVIRAKDQYRLFFSGGEFFAMTLRGKQIVGITSGKFTHPVACICSAEGASGGEEIYFGSTDGFVYQMEKGTSFDGSVIDWKATLAYNHIGSPRLLKQFRKAVFEASGTGYGNFNVGYSLAYGSSDYPYGKLQTVSAGTAQDVRWGSTYRWGNCHWNGSSLTPSEVELTGTAENMSIVLSGRSDEYAPFTINGALIHYTPRRNLR